VGTEQVQRRRNPYRVEAKTFWRCKCRDVKPQWWDGSRDSADRERRHNYVRVSVKLKKKRVGERWRGQGFSIEKGFSRIGQRQSLKKKFNR
jgi:hypothetical protein